MNTMEEALWNYIDGNCTPDEQKVITALIAEDESYRLKYQELLRLNHDFGAMELDGPSMAFTYNVIEAIRTENAYVPLKAAINKRVIIGITLFFTITMLALLVLLFASVKWSGMGAAVNLTADLPKIDPGQKKILLDGFVFFDVVLALYLLDGYLRKKTLSKQA